MMNTQTATAKAIDWSKLLRFLLRFAWATAVFIFRLVLIAFSVIITLITSRRDHQQEDDEVAETEVKYKFSSASKYDVYKNQTRF